MQNIEVMPENIWVVEVHSCGNSVQK